MAPSRTPLTIESIFAPSAIDTGMPAKATLTKSRLEYAFCMAPPGKRKHTWITNLDKKTRYFRVSYATRTINGLFPVELSDSIAS